MRAQASVRLHYNYNITKSSREKNKWEDNSKCCCKAKITPSCFVALEVFVYRLEVMCNGNLYAIFLAKGGILASAIGYNFLFVIRLLYNCY